MKPITFYDISSRLRTKAWSPNTWKTRYTLNYKRLPYTTEWVHMDAIDVVYKKLGANATQYRRDGSPIYTLPLIFDPNTNRTISDSLQIADYLDKQYPDTPPVIQFPALGPQHQAREAMLQAAFVDSFSTYGMGSVWQFTVLKVHDLLEDDTQVHFRTTREAMYKYTLEQIVPKGGDERWDREWAKVKKGFETVDGWYRLGESGKGGAGDVAGDQFSFADLVVGAALKYIKTLFGEDSREYQDLMSWSGGRWKRLTEKLVPYDNIDIDTKL